MAKKGKKKKTRARKTKERERARPLRPGGVTVIGDNGGKAPEADTEEESG